MIQVRSVDHILCVPILLISFDPLILLLHNLLEWIGKIAWILLILNNLVQSWVESHNWIIFLLCQIFHQTHSSDIIPALWILLKEPCIVIFHIHFWILCQIWNFGRCWIRSSAIFALIKGYVICEKLFYHAWLWNVCAWQVISSCNSRLILSEIQKRALIWWRTLECIETSDFGVVTQILPIENIVIVFVDLTWHSHSL